MKRNETTWSLHTAMRIRNPILRLLNDNVSRHYVASIATNDVTIITLSRSLG